MPRILPMAVIAAMGVLSGSATAQAPETIDGVANFYFTQGVLGVTCALLILVVIHLWRAREQDRVNHKVEIAAKDTLINELQEQRLTEAIAGRDMTKTYQTTLDAFLAAVRGGKGMP